MSKIRFPSVERQASSSLSVEERISQNPAAVLLPESPECLHGNRNFFPSTVFMHILTNCIRKGRTAKFKITSLTLQM